ncbi:hypothetical protein IJS18_02240 [Candidatus Saccharibacteria bacterium]|nr:hypothetical protein [Candidatus Saccharibacteria bacterium]
MEIESTHKWKKYLPILGVVVGVVVIVIIVLILMRGTTTTSGGYPNPESTKSLSCNSDTFVYPFFKYDNSTKKNTTITATFENEKMNRISLTYTLFYPTKEEVVKSEAENHAAMNISFSNAGLGPDSFGANYKELVSDPSALALAMTMTTLADNIRDVGAKYFMLEDIENKDYTLNDVRSTYRSAGFRCEVNN